MQIDDIITYDMQVTRQHINMYYIKLLGTSTARLVDIQSQLWDNSDKLIREQNFQLEKPFSLEEISKTIFSCNPSKASGPDGFSFFFLSKILGIN